MARIAREEVGDGFYVYAFLRENGSPYYIGKGKGRRAWDNSGRRVAKRPKDSLRILILKKGLTEEESFRHEKYMIAVLGRKDLGTGMLRNRTDGGEGGSGCIPTEETRIKMSEVKRGERHHAFGRSHSEEHRLKISEALRGREISAETRAKISASSMGRVHSAEARAKLSESRRGKRGNLFSRTGEKSYRAKTFIFMDQSGQEFVVTGRFEVFCREHGISSTTMQQALYRKCAPPPRNGWLVREGYTTV